ncbi:MAG: monovalent cation/H+ antiporter subunit D [Kofleriaceae bacterium]|nr:monovalent cation/H+ antiporter subunit D [Kofleriaceae bacterium]
MSAAVPQLLVVPIVLPLVSAALLVLLGHRKRLKTAVNLAATAAGLVVAVVLAQRVDAVPDVYLAGNWEAPFGIVLVADRLSALMLVVVGILGLAVALYAEAAWAPAAVYFHPLFQIQLMGLNGVFLTGDLFNLFVFFEVLLAASYGLQLHGSGWPRVRSGLHYISINLLASALFLVGLGVLYGVLGTLSMADLAVKIAQVPPGDRGLLYAGAALLAVAFLIKAGIWPLNAWLVPAYSAASAPVAALFVVMTKVGIYALLRLWTLFLASGTTGSGHIGATILLLGGLATLGIGALGMIGSLRLGRIASYSIIVSAGTMLAALGLDEVAATSAGLFYLVSASFAASPLFLLGELLERFEATPQEQLAATPLDEDTNLDDEAAPLIGRAFTSSVVSLGLAFVTCVVLVVGLPPLAGFLAKVALLTVAASNGTFAGWLLLGLLLVASLFALMSLARAGIRHLWPAGRTVSALKLTEIAAIGVLLLASVLLTVFAEPVLRYTLLTAAELHAPHAYVEAVLSTPPVPR